LRVFTVALFCWRLCPSFVFWSILLTGGAPSVDPCRPRTHLVPFCGPPSHLCSLSDDRLNPDFFPTLGANGSPKRNLKTSKNGPSAM
jgi:hypothetical protein